MILSHRIQLDPTVEQEIALARACGCARFTWNWALAEWKKQYEAGEKPTANKLKALWNKIKRDQFPWIVDSPKDANQQPFANLNSAFQRFFKKKARYPKFKKKKGLHDSFYVSNDQFSVEEDVVRLPVIGYVRLTEPLRFTGKIMSGTISRDADHWFMSISVEVSEYAKSRVSDGCVGIDLGLKTAIVLSDGKTFDAPEPLKKELRKLKRLSKRLSRKTKGSNNRAKARLKLARLHARVKAVRKDWTHKVTTKICRENQTIYLEDLNVRGMLSNHRLAKALSDVGFGEIRRQIEYKAKIYGCTVGIINRWYPSSKTCSSCGHVRDSIALSERVFNCPNCGKNIDRDLNAALNIRTAGLAGSNACGPEGSGSDCKVRTKPRRIEAGTKPRVHSHVLTN